MNTNIKADYSVNTVSICLHSLLNSTFPLKKKNFKTNPCMINTKQRVLLH